MNYKIPIWIITALFSFSISSAYAEIIEDPDRPGFVKDSYIITFKPPGQGEQPIVWPAKPVQSRGKVPFMQHSSGQSKTALAAQLALSGEIVSILDLMNAIHVHMPTEEAERFRRDNRVFSVHQGWITVSAGVRDLGDPDYNGTTGYWALDRLNARTEDNLTDYERRFLDGKFHDNYGTPGSTGKGRKIFILDTGINYDVPIVLKEFAKLDENGQETGTYRLLVWDITNSVDINAMLDSSNSLTVFDNSDSSDDPDSGFYAGLNGGHGSDISVNGSEASGTGHGTMVAVAAGGNYLGVARDATVISIKIATQVPSGGQYSLSPYFGSADSNTETAIFHWFASNPNLRGSIVNWSRGYRDYSGGCGNPTIDLPLEQAMSAAHANNIIIVVAAHNDGCNTANYTPTRLGRYNTIFVVGGTSFDRIQSYNQDVIYSVPDTANGGYAHRSRFGVDISVFAPAEQIKGINGYSYISEGRGTSYATAFVSGLFASACEATGICDTTPVDTLYGFMRAAGQETVVDENGSDTAIPGFNGVGKPVFLFKTW